MSENNRLGDHLRRLVDFEVERGSEPFEVFQALLEATGYALFKADHKDIDNITDVLGKHIAATVQHEVAKKELAK